MFDLHASPTLLGLFMRGNSYDSVYRFERHMVLPKILAQNCPDYRVVHQVLQNTARASLPIVGKMTYTVYVHLS